MASVIGVDSARMLLFALALALALPFSVRSAFVATDERGERNSR